MQDWIMTSKFQEAAVSLIDKPAATAKQLSDQKLQSLESISKVIPTPTA